jgi:hypothetical protein
MVPDTVAAGDGEFLSEMGPHMGNPELMRFTAIAGPCVVTISNPVYSASAGQRTQFLYGSDKSMLSNPERLSTNPGC